MSDIPHFMIIDMENQFQIPNKAFDRIISILLYSYFPVFFVFRNFDLLIFFRCFQRYVNFWEMMIITLTEALAVLK